MTKTHTLSKVGLLLMLALDGGIANSQEREGGKESQNISPNTELTQLRNAWLLERKLAVVRLDLGYQESLEALLERVRECKDAAALALVEKEIEERQAQFDEAKAEMPPTNSATGGKIQDGSQASFMKGQATLLAGKLVGRIWRVDHEGEGLRWYYFAEDGSLARKSRLTNWVWTDTNGLWRVDPRGVVEIRSEGPTAQVLIGERGQPFIAINRQGSLSQRPLKETDLEYPGKGKE